ncbi:hypothetical protein [Pseudomonas piscis]|uniref:hypothetical protein n=1 Tax=Pseudomonas piscis TaxID=2614538 RepID=UPI0024AE52F2
MSLSDLPLRQSQLLKFVEPLLNDMPASAWKHALFEAFWSQRRDLLAIEDAFLKLVQYPGPGLAAVDACTEAMAIAPDEPAARNLFAQYLQRRSRAMLACARVLPADSSPNSSGHPHE